jgi:hypothetical protein
MTRDEKINALLDYFVRDFGGYTVETQLSDILLHGAKGFLTMSDAEIDAEYDSIFDGGEE